MTLYIGGHMRRHPTFDPFNFTRFNVAADALRRAGYAVISPVDLDHIHGFNEYHDTVTPEFVCSVLERDKKAMEECDGMAVLPDWEGSGGTAEEVAFAQRVLDIPVKGVDEWLALALEGKRQ